MTNTFYDALLLLLTGKMSVVGGGWTGLVGAAGAGLVALAGYRRYLLTTTSMKWKGQEDVRLEGKTAIVTGANTGNNILVL